MEFSIKHSTPEKQKSACVVLGIFEPRKLSDAAATVNRLSSQYLDKILQSGDMEGKLGSTLLLYGVPGTLGERVLLVGLGKEEEFNEHAYRQSIQASILALNERGARDVASFLTEIPVPGRSLSWRIEQCVAMSMDALYVFTHPSCKKHEHTASMHKLEMSVAQASDLNAAQAGLSRGLAVAAGVRTAKDLGNLPGNLCTPSHIAAEAHAFAASYGLEIQVLERADMEKLGMGSLLSVSRGSRQEPKLVVLKYQKGTKGEAPIALVGKGITFDTGGISIKPSAEMDEMKFDMSGAASVLGTLKAVAEMELKLNVVGVMPCCENMPDGNATKPGDVVTSLSGKTIEILNTDAEGRLILCDAITYAIQHYAPRMVIDIATLTGACVVALGHFPSGLFSNSDTLAQSLIAAGEETCDRVWRLPLWDDYQKLLTSNFADLPNIAGGRAAGSITAACFLSRFVDKTDWAHLDIAGTAWKSGKEKGSTGRPVPLLVEFLCRQATN